MNFKIKLNSFKNKNEIKKNYKIYILRNISFDRLSNFWQENKDYAWFRLNFENIQHF